jgi:hypothetical protein
LVPIFIRLECAILGRGTLAARFALGFVQHLHRALFGAPVRGKWNVRLKVHSVVGATVQLMSVRGVGAIVSLTFGAAIDDPAIAFHFRC